VILDAIERLLARYGYKKTTMDDLAGEAGIGKGTIYLYFPSKEEVALQSIDRVVERVQDRLRAIADTRIGVAEKLRQMIRERILQRFDSVQAYAQSLDDLFESLRPAYMERRERYFQAEAKIFAKVLAEGRRRGVIAVDDVRATAHAILVATNSLLPYSLSARELGERAEIEAQAKRLAGMLLHGLLQTKPRSRARHSKREMVR
jgi:AcrR family transcriptional regulator